MSYSSQASGYDSHNSQYNSQKTTWVKTTCCGAYRGGARCTDCPGE